MTSPAATGISPTATSAESSGPKGLFVAVLDWLIRADETYRMSRRLEETPDELLNDMGITRNELEQMLANRPS